MNHLSSVVQCNMLQYEKIVVTEKTGTMEYFIVIKYLPLHIKRS